MRTLLIVVGSFGWGYTTYPLLKMLKIYRLAKQIDNTMKSIYAEQKEIRDLLNEVDKDWHKKHE